jgi:hypothetical protein
MRTRTMIAILIALVLTIWASAIWSATTLGRDGDPEAGVTEDSGPEAGSATEPKKGNKVAR